MADGIEILVDGFFDNPVLSWVFQDEATRARGLEDWFRFWQGHYGDEGLLIVTDEGDGAALWATPKAAPLAGDSIGGFVEVVTRYNGDRTGLVLGAFSALHPPEEPHWYLNAISARRGERARGVGARLLEPFLERSDREGIGIYLESSNARNLSFYYRYDFEDQAPRIDLPESGPAMQPMWRPAQRSRNP
jgi:ribosomal protein S18 acetylase RimI-like enzyme